MLNLIVVPQGWTRVPSSFYAFCIIFLQISLLPPIHVDDAAGAFIGYAGWVGTSQFGCLRSGCLDLKNEQSFSILYKIINNKYVMILICIQLFIRPDLFTHFPDQFTSFPNALVSISSRSRVSINGVLGQPKFFLVWPKFRLSHRCCLAERANLFTLIVMYLVLLTFFLSPFRVIAFKLNCILPLKRYHECILNASRGKPDTLI